MNKDLHQRHLNAIRNSVMTNQQHDEYDMAEECTKVSEEYIAELKEQLKDYKGLFKSAQLGYRELQSKIDIISAASESLLNEIKENGVYLSSVNTLIEVLPKYKKDNN